MKFNEYSERAHATAIYPEGVAYPALGLAGETGEVCEKLKKYIRDGKIDWVSLRMELGDVLWYLNELCIMCETTLEDVARANVEKLESRKERGVLKGNGDNR